MTTLDSLQLTRELDDPEDAALLGALADMQAIVTRHLLEARLSIDDLDEVEQQALADKLTPYLNFELSQSEGIWVGMPFTASGDGGILVADQAGSIIAAQHMAGADRVTGIVGDVLAFPVPAIECMRVAADEAEHAIPSFTQSFSAVVVLQNAKFHTQGSTGGMSSETEHDLSGMQVIVPVAYGMQMSMPGMVDL